MIETLPQSVRWRRNQGFPSRAHPCCICVTSLQPWFWTHNPCMYCPSPHHTLRIETGSMLWSTVLSSGIQTSALIETAWLNYKMQTLFYYIIAQHASIKLVYFWVSDLKIWCLSCWIESLPSSSFSYVLYMCIWISDMCVWSLKVDVRNPISKNKTKQTNK